MDWSDDDDDDDGQKWCWNCEGWGNCYDCHFDRYDFGRDEFLDVNENYYKYKHFLLDKYDPKDVTLWSNLDDFGNGFAYIHRKYHRLSIENGKVVLTPGYNPQSLQTLASREIIINHIPIENERIEEMLYLNTVY